MIRRERNRASAPMNSGSRRKPERINLRCTTEQCGRALSAVEVAEMIIRGRDPSAEANISTAFHSVIIPVFEKVIRAYRFGSAAEQAAAKVYLEELIRKEDYIKNRPLRYQLKFEF
jgi:hypothetical protein